MSTKKQLLQEVFNKAGQESGKSTKNGVSEYLVLKLEEKLDTKISERTLIRYYDVYISETVKKNNIEIDLYILNKLSQYLGYSCFEHFSNPNDFVFDELNGGYVRRPFELQDFYKIVQGGLNINIQNIIKIPDFIRNNKAMSLGFVGLFIATSLIAHFNGYFQKKDHMYWNGTEYRLTTALDLNPKHDVIVLDTVKFKYFKKITRPDTLDADNGLNNVWYSKYQNKVEFFTMDGKNPDNQKELRPVSERIILKYAGEAISE